MRIFISYRRDDTSGYAGRLHDRLTGHFGEDSIFMDIDTIKPGQDFVKVVGEAVGSCDVLITLIGPQWLSMTDSDGFRRLDNPNDFIRLEVTTALHREVVVIPVLVHGARMPGPRQLPDSMSSLSRKQAIELSDNRFHEDANRLIARIEEVLVESGSTSVHGNMPPTPPAPVYPTPTAPPAVPAAYPQSSPVPAGYTNLDENIAQLASRGYTITARTDSTVVMAQKAPVNAVLLIGWLLIFPIAAVIYAAGVRKEFRVQLTAQPDGRVVVSGDTPAQMEQHLKTAGRNGWLLIGGVVLIYACICSLAILPALFSGSY